MAPALRLRLQQVHFLMIDRRHPEPDPARFVQILVLRGNELVPVRLGKPLDSRLSGPDPRIVVRIEKVEGYRVMTIHRLNGKARQFEFSEAEVSGPEPDELA